MSLQCYLLTIITEILQISTPFISKWKGVYLRGGVMGLNTWVALPRLLPEIVTSVPT